MAESKSPKAGLVIKIPAVIPINVVVAKPASNPAPALINGRRDTEVVA